MNKKNWISAVTICVLIVGYYLLDKYYISKRPILYPNFGISIPAGYTTHGIDVSRYQKDIDWNLVSKMTDKGQKISFVIIKATEGTNLTDNYFKQNWKESEDYSLIRGAYLYFHPNKDGIAQANYFLSKVNLQSGDLPPIIDIEELNGVNIETMKKKLMDCLNVLEKKYDKKPIIYASVDFYEKNLGEKFDEYPFWAAHYEQAKEPRTKRNWIIWQHNSKGRVNGIEAAVDFNVVNGSIYALRAICL